MLELLLEIATKYEKLVNCIGIIATIFLVFITILYNNKIIKETKKSIRKMEKANKISLQMLENTKKETEENKRIRDLEVVSDLIEKKIVGNCFFFFLEERSFYKYLDKIKKEFEETYVKNKLKTVRFENIGDCVVDKREKKIYYSIMNKTFKEAIDYIYKPIEDLKFLKGILVYEPYLNIINRILDEKNGNKLEKYKYYRKTHKEIIENSLGSFVKLEEKPDTETIKILQNMWEYNAGFTKQLKENTYYLAFKENDGKIEKLKNIYYQFDYFNKIKNNYKLKY